MARFCVFARSVPRHHFSRAARSTSSAWPIRLNGALRALPSSETVEHVFWKTKTVLRKHFPMPLCSLGGCHQCSFSRACSIGSGESNSRGISKNARRKIASTAVLESSRQVKRHRHEQKYVAQVEPFCRYATWFTFRSKVTWFTFRTRCFALELTVILHFSKFRTQTFGRTVPVGCSQTERRSRRCSVAEPVTARSLNS